MKDLVTPEIRKECLLVEIIFTRRQNIFYNFLLPKNKRGYGFIILNVYIPLKVKYFNPNDIYLLILTNAQIKLKKNTLCSIFDG